MWTKVEAGFPEEYSYVFAKIKPSSNSGKTMVILAFYDSAGHFYDVSTYYARGKLIRVVSYQLDFIAVAWMDIPK